MGDFIVGKKYTCTSLIGMYPSFTPVGATDDVYAKMNEGVFVKTKGGLYEIKKPFVLFKEDAVYTCERVSPHLILDGPISDPVSNTYVDLAKALPAMTELCLESNCSCGQSIMYQLLKMIKWEITNEWDSTKQGLKKILLMKLNLCVEPYKGSVEGYGSSQSEDALLMSVFLPYDWKLLTSVDISDLPHMSVIWKDGQTPYVVLDDGTKLLEYYKDCLTPQTEQSTSSLSKIEI